MAIKNMLICWMLTQMMYMLCEAKDSKVVGGVYFTLKNAPFIARLVMPSYMCGGSLLSLDTVLTGCHCVAKITSVHPNETIRPAHTVLVSVGSEYSADPYVESQTRRGSKIALHPKCQSKVAPMYDFAVISLESPFKPGPKVQPLNVPYWDKKRLDLKTRMLIGNNKIECYVAGWGATIDGKSSKTSDRLKAAKMTIIPDAECAKILSNSNVKFENYSFSENGQMCALSKGRKNESDCQGDSGGPFFCGKFVYGVVSYGYECGLSTMPSVYGKLSYFVEWYSSYRKNLKPEELRRSSRGTIIAANIATQIPIVIYALLHKSL